MGFLLREDYRTTGGRLRRLRVVRQALYVVFHRHGRKAETLVVLTTIYKDGSTLAAFKVVCIERFNYIITLLAANTVLTHGNLICLGFSTAWWKKKRCSGVFGGRRW